jgi:two-component system, NtrC family, sensor kinase
MNVEAFAWGQLFETGIDSVDAQHHRLVDLVNELGDVNIIREGMSEGSMQILFKQLSDYAREHFHDEEALMRKAGLDARHLEPHIRHHHLFVEQLTAMWRARAAMKHPCETFYDFLSAWLTFHILGEDQVMARQMERIHAGETATAAYEIESQPKDNSSAALLLAVQTLYRLLAEQNRELADTNERLLREIAAHRS